MITRHATLTQFFDNPDIWIVEYDEDDEECRLEFRSEAEGEAAELELRKRERQERAARRVAKAKEGPSNG
jgi:hypothetical protein